mmetsp:Transcript_19972/g.65053  ORF Transcript_19972/g.65053 Transcript_19972/m.65053 type:complete len:228 (-) Transcript_19972:2689-3372(-)
MGRAKRRRSSSVSCSCFRMCASTSTRRTAPKRALPSSTSSRKPLRTSSRSSNASSRLSSGTCGAAASTPSRTRAARARLQPPRPSRSSTSKPPPTAARPISPSHTACAWAWSRLSSRRSSRTCASSRPRRRGCPAPRLPTRTRLPLPRARRLSRTSPTLLLVLDSREVIPPRSSARTSSPRTPQSSTLPRTQTPTLRAPRARPPSGMASSHASEATPPRSSLPTRAR